MVGHDFSLMPFIGRRTAERVRPATRFSFAMPTTPPATGTANAVPGRGAQPTCDVAVIGGGPAGSTTAALLAQRGYRVTLFDKDRHPRFHIGESLLPANLRLFEQLGVADEIRA